jgi:predicted ATPase
MQGWVQAARGQQQEGIVQLREGIADWQATGAALRLPYYLALLAEAQSNGGQEGDALSLLDVALAQGERTQERHYQAELYRLKGEFVLQSGFRGPASKITTGPRSEAWLERSRRGHYQESSQPKSRILNPESRTEAETCFLKAIDIARKQKARSFELRATMSLARLWQQHGKAKQAHKMLSKIYNWFTEGFDTKDLQEAQALLEELSH